jgi:hypothetical protein
MGLILCAPLFMKPLELTWFDTPLNYHYTVEVTTTDGSVYEVPRLFLAPYDMQFVQNALWFLEDRPVATTTYGMVRTPDALAELETQTASLDPEDLKAALSNLEESIGEDETDEDARARLRTFLRTFFRNVNTRGDVRRVAPIPTAPHHIFSFPDPEVATLDGVFDFQAPVERVRVLSRVHYIADRPIELRREVVLDEPVPTKPQ